MDAIPSTGISTPATSRPPFERIALVLQGGGALGAYQGGVYAALAEHGLHPDWVAGISIGAINAAIIAGNRPEQRAPKLRQFWKMVSQSPLGVPAPPIKLDPTSHRWVNQSQALGTALFGAPNFFRPRFPSPALLPASPPTELGLYDMSPVRETLKELVDYDLLNSGVTRMSVGTVNIKTGNFLYFDTATQRIEIDHIMASGALPPGFAAVRIEGEYYWDGGIVSNTPLDWILESTERRDTLTFQVDLWNAMGVVPRTLMEAEVREKEIRFSSRTRLATDRFRREQRQRRALAELLKDVPPDRRDTGHARMLAAGADDKVYNIIQLIYHSQSYEGSSKDYEFSRATMEEHWAAGYNDTIRTLRHPEVLQRPSSLDGVFTFDVARQGRL